MCFGADGDCLLIILWSSSFLFSFKNVFSKSRQFGLLWILSLNIFFNIKPIALLLGVFLKRIQKSICCSILWIIKTWLFVIKRAQIYWCAIHKFVRNIFTEFVISHQTFAKAFIYWVLKHWLVASKSLLLLDFLQVLFVKFSSKPLMMLELL